MTKRLIRTVACDDCTVTVGGAESCPHMGETVTLRGWFDLPALVVMHQLGDLLEQSSDAEDLDSGDALLERFVGSLAERVYSWTWTDSSGNSLPQPYRNPEAFRGLGLDELIYLGLLVTPKLLEGQRVTRIPRWLRRLMRRN